LTPVLGALTWINPSVALQLTAKAAVTVGVVVAAGIVTVRGLGGVTVQLAATVSVTL
jgi:hypothetical protein